MGKATQTPVKLARVHYVKQAQNGFTDYLPAMQHQATNCKTMLKKMSITIVTGVTVYIHTHFANKVFVSLHCCCRNIQTYRKGSLCVQRSSICVAFGSSNEEKKSLRVCLDDARIRKLGIWLRCCVHQQMLVRNTPYCFLWCSLN